jgi:large subunit ribosomal protein L5
MNPMEQVRIEKVTLNIGAGKEQAVLEKGISVIKSLTGIEPQKRVASKRIPAWGVRPGLPVGCRLTLRGPDAEKMLKRALKAKDFTLTKAHFDNAGSIAFGIPEHIDIEGAQYDPKIGVMGLQICVTLEKPGFHVKRRRVRPASIGRKHRITQEESMRFMKEHFGVTVAEEEKA